MELLYIWIEKYKNIKKQGFNFSAKFLFDFNPQTNELTVEENPNHIEDFFPEGISNVTAIIGKNGRGKSSVLETIAKCLYELGPRYFTIFRKENEVILKEGQILPFKKDNKIQDKTNLNIQFIEKNQGGFLKEIYDKHQTEIIEYSTVFDANYNFNTKGYYLEENAIHKVISNNYKLKQIRHNISEIYLNDIIDIVRFFTADILKEQPLKLPIHLSFNVKYFKNHIRGTEYIKETQKGFGYSFLQAEIQKHNRVHPKYDADSSGIILNQVLWSLICNFIYHPTSIQYWSDIIFITQIQSQNLEHFLEPYINNDKENQKSNIRIWILDFFDDIKTQVKERRKQLDLDSESIKLDKQLPEFEKERSLRGFKQAIGITEEQIFVIENIENLITEFTSVLKEKPNFLIQANASWLSDNFGVISQNIIHVSDINGNLDKIKLKKLLKLFDLLHKTSPYFPVGEWLNFNWQQISSGELNFLTLFGRLFSIREFDKKDCIILLDEPDLGSHPQWQKELVSNLLFTLPQIFPDKNIQIILTSHSPFLASDLPNSNIIFLEKDTEGNCLVKDSLNDMKETFGANIHTLLTDSFFMKGGLIGDFAKEKIDEVIKDLSSREDFGERRKNQIKNIINAIGEPIIKRKLMQMFEDKFNLDIDDRISRLEKEVKNLKKQRDNNDSD